MAGILRSIVTPPIPPPGPAQGPDVRPGSIGSLSRAAEEIGVPLGLPEAGKLAGFEELLRIRGSRLGVVAGGDLDRLRERHILDCLRAAAVTTDETTAYDLGSGGGLPGVVIACARPELRIDLVESRRLRASFLELVIERLALANVRLVPRPIEDLADPADLCFTRALAAPGRCWELAEPLLAPGGRLVYFAGSALSEADLPSEVTSRWIPPPPALASSGPLVIMSRP